MNGWVCASLQCLGGSGSRVYCVCNKIPPKMRSCERKQTGSIWNGESRWPALVFITNENYRWKSQSCCGLHMVFGVCVAATSGPLCATTCPTVCLSSLNLTPSPFTLFCFIARRASERVCAQNSTVHVLPHMPMLPVGVTGGEGGWQWIWIVFSMEAEQLWPLCQHMKWNQMPGMPWKLESLSCVQK